MKNVYSSHLTSLHVHDNIHPFIINQQDTYIGIWKIFIEI